MTILEAVRAGRVPDDVATWVLGARDRDEATSRARHRREPSRPANGDVCTMCGDLCAYKTYRESREGEW